MCGRIPVVIDRRPAAITAARLSLRTTVRRAPAWICAIPTSRASRDPVGMSRRSAHCGNDRRGRSDTGSLSDDLYDYAGAPAPRLGRPPKHDLETWTITDDWPARAPVTDAEVDVFEAWFGDLFDELFGQCR
jgi:hypothetical protein